MAGKIKALQIWCKNRTIGYRDVEVTNMTTSWRDGLAFCALIHKFKPELIDFESLSKENVYENNALAFEVALTLGVPALLDAEDMERLETPDKLSIITYVAQLHNCFKDMEPVGGPNVQLAVKRPRKASGVTSPESKRMILPSSDTENKTDSSPAIAEICHVCDGKVYLIEKHIADGKMYHRSCFKQTNRKSDTSALSQAGKFGSPRTVPQAVTPTTPTSPPDTRPLWQRQLAEKQKASKADSKQDARKRLSAIIVAEQGGDQTPSKNLTPKPVPAVTAPLRKHNSAAAITTPAKSSAPTTTTPANRPVTLRNVGPPVTTQNARRAPRPVSSGVNLEEKVEKLRQLREQTKSNRTSSPEVQARLERLRNRVKSGTPMDTTDTSPPTRPRRSIAGVLGVVMDNIGDVKEETPVTGDVKEKDEATSMDSDKAAEQPTIESTKLKPTEQEPISQESEKHISQENVTTESEPSRECSGRMDPEANTVTPGPLQEVQEEASEEDESMSISSDTPVTNEQSQPNDNVTESENPEACHGNTSESVEAATKAEPSQTEAQSSSPGEEMLSVTNSQSSADFVSEKVENTEESMDESPSVQETEEKTAMTDDETTTTPSPTESPPKVSTPSVTLSLANVSIGKSPSPPARPKRAASIKSIQVNKSAAEKPVDPKVAPARRLSNCSLVDITVSCSPSNSRRSSTVSIEDANPLLQDTETENDPSKSPKPARPALPKLSKLRETSQEETSEEITPKKTEPVAESPVTKLQTPSKPPPPRPHSPVVMRKSPQPKHKTPAPPRPATVAAGVTSKSMDNNQKNVAGPPAKPARTKDATNGRPSWENALDNWSSKRKEPKQGRNTWYTTEEYPEENNPFGADEDEAAEAAPDNDKPVYSYDDSMNPFAEDEEEHEETHSSDTISTNPFGEVDEEETSSAVIVEKQCEKKVIRANPFDVSDEEEEAETHPEDETPSMRKKITPDVELTNGAEQSKSSIKVLPQLPKARSPSTQKKRIAPLPPTSINNNATEVKPDIDSKLSTPQQDIEETNLKTNSNPSPDTVVHRKSKPAPPRPMPPKRRVDSEYDLSTDSVQSQLEAIEQKQRELEMQGRQLEKAIRQADDAMGDQDDEDALLSKWFETINEKNYLVRRESELVYISKQHDLETQQADIEWELRQIMHKAENLKTDSDKCREEELLQKLVSVVHDRSKLVDKMDDERLRQQEEDYEVEQVLGAKFGGDKTPDTSAKKGKEKPKAKKKDKEKDKGKKSKDKVKKAK